MGTIAEFAGSLHSNAQIVPLSLQEPVVTQSLQEVADAFHVQS